MTRTTCSWPGRHRLTRPPTTQAQNTEPDSRINCTEGACRCGRYPSAAMTPPGTTVLITLPGRDRPGVTSRLFGLLAGYPLAVLDIEQVVIRGRLVVRVLLGR